MVNNAVSSTSMVAANNLLLYQPLTRSRILNDAKCQNKLKSLLLTKNLPVTKVILQGQEFLFEVESP